MDDADVEGGVAEGGVGEAGEGIAEVVIEGIEGADEFDDGVFAEVGLRGVGGFSGGAEGGPEGAFGGVDDLHRGGFADEGEPVVVAVVFGEVFAAPLAGFLAHEGDEVDGGGECGEAGAVFVECPEHGGHGAFGV